jgi:hypothetical protein
MMTDVRTSANRRINLGVMAGVVGVTLPAASNALVPIWQFPGTSTSGKHLANFIVEHQDALRGVALLDTAGVTFWMIFGGAVWLRLRRASDIDTIATTLFALGLGGLVIMVLSGFTSFFVLTYRAPDPITARILYDVTFGLLAMSGMPTAVALISFAAAVLTTKHLPRHTAGLAIVAAAVHVLLIASLVIPRGVLSLEGPMITAAPALLFAWILATALTLRSPMTRPST